MSGIPVYLTKEKILLELVSIMISFASFLQNAKKDKQIKEKISDIIKAIDEVEKIYALLIKSKTTHDEFEKFDAAALTPLIDSINADRDRTQKNIKKELETFLKLSKMILKHLDVKYDENWIIDHDDLEKMPSTIKINVENIYRIYPKYADSIIATKNNLQKIKSLKESKDFGDHLDKCIILLENSVQEGRASADDLIINISPIISHIHHEIRSTLEAI